MLSGHSLSFAGSRRAKAVVARQTGNPALSYVIPTGNFPLDTVVESFLDPDDYTEVYVFPNSAAVSSFTSELPSFELLSAAATTAAAAQTTSAAAGLVTSIEQQFTITSYAYPTTSTSSFSTHSTPTFPPTTPSSIPQPTAINPSPPPPSSSSPLPSPPLSSTAKAIISIGASLGFLSLALLIFSIYRYLKHKQRSRQMHAANISPILPSSPATVVKAAEKSSAMGSQELGSGGYRLGNNGAVQASKQEGRDGLAVLHELGGVAVVDTLGELSGVSSGEDGRGSGVRFVLGRTELA